MNSKQLKYGFLGLILTLHLFPALGQLGKGVDAVGKLPPDFYVRNNIYRDPVKVFLNKFSFTLTTGYGNTHYNHDLQGVYFYQDDDQQLIFNNSETLPRRFQGFNNWLNDPMRSDTILFDAIFDVPYNYLPNPVFNDTLRINSFVIDTDTTNLSFSGVYHSIPVQLSLHYNYGDFRVGGGFNWERQWAKSLDPNILTNQVRPYAPNFKATSFTRWFGMIGYKIYEYWEYNFFAELEVGNINAGRQFNDNVISRGLYTTIGISIEQTWSEYFRLILKPSYEIKNYSITLPDGSPVIRHSQNAFFLKFGISINIPEIPRSPIEADHVQLKHVITDPKTGRRMEVRGQPFWKVQNPKVGQNHRKLWRNKNKNKRKMNPY